MSRFCDQPGENVQAASGALGIRLSINVRRQVKGFEQRHNEHRARLKHRRTGQVNFLDQQIVNFLGDRRLPRKKAGPDLVRLAS